MLDSRLRDILKQYPSALSEIEHNEIVDKILESVNEYIQTHNKHKPCNTCDTGDPFKLALLNVYHTLDEADKLKLIRAVLSMKENKLEDMKNNPAVTQTVADTKSIEQHKLKIWIARTYSLFAMSIVTAWVVTYLWLAYLKKEFPKINWFESIVENILDIVSIVVNPGG